MPISGQGWELHIVREKEQRRASNGRRRTVGRYQVFHDGVAQTGKGLKGATAEAKGPGANKPAGNGKRIEQGRYPLATQEPGHYMELCGIEERERGAETRARAQGYGAKSRDPDSSREECVSFEHRLHQPLRFASQRQRDHRV